jgi:hypothetical protein
VPLAKSRSSSKSRLANGFARRARSRRNAMTFVRMLRHLRHERHFRIVAIAEQLRGFVAQREDAQDERTVVPLGRAPEVRSARRVRLVHQASKIAVVRVLHDRQVAGHAQRELPAALPSACAAALAAATTSAGSPASTASSSP